jgi:hypothetical protein
MSLAAENKRRLIAAIATLVLLIAVGFAIGRATNGPPTATPSRLTEAAAARRRSPTASDSALKADLATSRRADSAAAWQLANLHAANRRLRDARARANRMRSRARRCQRLGAARRYRQCVTEALS